MEKRKRIKNFSFVVLASFLFYLSFPNVFTPYGFSFLAWLSLIPFLHVLEKSSLVNRFLYSVCFGLISYGLLVRWVIDVSGAGYILFVSVLCVQSIIFGCLYPRRCGPIFLKALYLGCLWVMSEFFREFLMGGFTWGFGLSQSFHPMIIQFADITGVKGLSFALVCVNVCLYGAIKQKEQRRSSFLGVFLIFLGIFSYSHGVFNISDLQSEGRKYLRVCSIQPNFSPENKHNPNFFDKNLDQQIKLSYECLDQTPLDLLIWPETSLVDDIIQDDITFYKIETMLRLIKTPMVLGTVLGEDEHYYNSALFVDERGDVKKRYDKQKLIPFAEYNPTAIFKNMLYKKDYEFQSGLKDERTRLGNITFNVAICSEDFYPRLWRRMSQPPLDLMIVLLNDGWFQSDEGMFMHLQSSILQAVTFKTSVLRSSNNGVTTFIDPFGVLSASSKNGFDVNQEKVFSYFVETNKSNSFYAQFGDIFAMFCSLFVIIILLIDSRCLGNDRHLPFLTSRE